MPRHSRAGGNDGGRVFTLLLRLPKCHLSQNCLTRLSRPGVISTAGRDLSLLGKLCSSSAERSLPAVEMTDFAGCSTVTGCSTLSSILYEPSDQLVLSYTAHS